MELYISDHPLDCLTCAANGDCELQDMAGAVGLRDLDGAIPRARVNHDDLCKPRQPRQALGKHPLFIERRNHDGYREQFSHC